MAAVFVDGSKTRSGLTILEEDREHDVVGAVWLIEQGIDIGSIPALNSWKGFFDLPPHTKTTLRCGDRIKIRAGGEIFEYIIAQIHPRCETTRYGGSVVATRFSIESNGKAK